MAKGGNSPTSPGSTGCALEPRATRFEVVVQLLHHDRKERLTVHVGVEGDPPTIPSVTELWPTADFMERETFDMFGITFDGHPNLTRILMPDEWEGHPLRKDYGVGKVPVEFIEQSLLQIDSPGQSPKQPETGARSRSAGPGRGRRRCSMSTTEETDRPSSRRPARERSSRPTTRPTSGWSSTWARCIRRRTVCCACCSSSTVRRVLKCMPVIGYLHTGMEKECEDNNWRGAVTIVTRMDYLACLFNEQAYSMAVEALLGIEVPQRGVYIRTMIAEINRLSSHLVWWGTQGLDMGAMSAMFYGFRERETDPRLLRDGHRACA